MRKSSSAKSQRRCDHGSLIECLLLANAGITNHGRIHVLLPAATAAAAAVRRQLAAWAPAGQPAPLHKPCPHFLQYGWSGSLEDLDVDAQEVFQEVCGAWVKVL